ncbi:hypothetical protein RhiirB3_13873 [Rhizophagus irregularis]|nr:hypothetical protein RhiirB3_13873 [Rhizophagus irregularis]
MYWNFYGPSFGNGDLIIYGEFQSEASFNENTSSYCKKVCYEKQIRETGNKFSVEEYEVFQIHNE